MADFYSIDLSIESQQIFNAIVDVWGMKSLNSEYMYASKGFYEMLGIPICFDVIGKKDIDLPISNKCKTNLSLYDEQIVSGHYISTIEIYSNNSKIQSYLFRRVPIFKDGVLKYFAFAGTKLKHIIPDHVILDPNRFNVDQDYLDNFSISEKLILWLLIAKFNPKEIAKITGSSVDYIRNVKKKAVAIAHADNFAEIRNASVLREWIIEYPPIGILKTPFLLKKLDLSHKY